MDQEEAIEFCANLGQTKKHGQVYELPSVQQLQDVLDYAFFGPALTPEVFKGVVSSTYWSATPSAGPGSLVWGVDVHNGGVFALCLVCAP